MRISNSILCLAVALSLYGCASSKTADMASAEDTAAAVAEVTALMQRGERIQADLLAFKAHREASEHYRKAQKGLAGNYQPDYILDNAAEAKIHAETMLAQAKERSPNATRILQSRKAALDAGLKNSERLVVMLADVDDDLRDETRNFARVLDPEDFSEFQKRYFALEVRAVQFRELDAVKQQIRQAVARDADDLAPKTLRTARFDVNEAENLIAQSPRDPGVHMPSVRQAVASVGWLTDAMEVIISAPGTPEDVALRIVKQNRELEKLAKNVGTLQQDLKSTQSTLMETEGALAEQNRELANASTQVRFQRAMDEAVRQFSDDEASVYQQGDKLIFRLKKINFPSGTANIPASSKPLLGKVDEIIRSLGAKLVAVEGHTDSVGAPDLNKKLSTDRAISVANYLASLAGGYQIGYIGYGEDRPIATNETREGRAINRRVDLVVTAKP